MNGKTQFPQLTEEFVTTVVTGDGVEAVVAGVGAGVGAVVTGVGEGVAPSRKGGQVFRSGICSLSHVVKCDTSE